MIDNSSVSILVLTRNEEMHIRRCLLNALTVTDRVFVLDSESIDKTQDIAKEMGVEVISGKFDSFSDKLNWGIKNIDFRTQWVMRLDADEILSKEFKLTFGNFLKSVDLNVHGVFVRRQLCFMGRKMVYGGISPAYSLRIWRPGSAFCESRHLDEHMILAKGRSCSLNVEIIDAPLTDLSVWINKHNNYASLEALTEIEATQGGDIQEPRGGVTGSTIRRVRWTKVNIYYKLPLFFRSFIYYIYRYIIRLGFLDGLEGFVFHFLHALWYRILVDSKIFEIRRGEGVPLKKIGKS